MGARAAESARLESVCGLAVTVGSNPTPSAKTLWGSGCEANAGHPKRVG